MEVVVAGCSIDVQISLQHSVAINASWSLPVAQMSGVRVAAVGSNVAKDRASWELDKVLTSSNLWVFRMKIDTTSTNDKDTSLALFEEYPELLLSLALVFSLS